MSKRAEQAWADYEYREHPKGLYYTCYVDGYEQAEKDIIAAICEQIELWMTDWKEDDEYSKGEAVAFRSVLHLLQEIGRV